MQAFSVQVTRGIRMVETTGVPIADADDVVVLLGGVRASARWIHDVAERCQRTVAVLAVDHVVGSADDHLDLAMVLAAFCVSDAVVVGSGTSARAALDLCRHEPGRVRSMLLIEPDGLSAVSSLGHDASSADVEILCGDSGPGNRMRSDHVTYVPGLDADEMTGSAAGIDATMAALYRALKRRAAPSPAASRQ